MSLVEKTNGKRKLLLEKTDWQLYFAMNDLEEILKRIKAKASQIGWDIKDNGQETN